MNSQSEVERQYSHRLESMIQGVKGRREERRNNRRLKNVMRNLSAFGWFAVFASIGQVFEGWVGWMRTGGTYILAASLCNWMAVLLCCVFVMLIQRNVKRNRVFVASNERLLRSIGIAVIADGIAQYLLFVYYRSGESFTDPGTIILLGIFFLFIACLFKVGIRMKEEQDLTI